MIQIAHAVFSLLISGTLALVVYATARLLNLTFITNFFAMRWYNVAGCLFTGWAIGEMFL